MTKLKNTKKGMAKKALSVSLVAAMLATSNVPVWAAEDLFSDGSAAVEAPAAEVETFGSEPAEEVNEAVQAQASATSTDYSVEPTINGVTDDKVVWNNTTGVNATFSIKAENGQAIPSNVKFSYAWKVNGLANALTSITDTASVTTAAPQLTADDAGKSLTLYIQAVDTNNNNNVIWEYTSDAITIDAVDETAAMEENIKLAKSESEYNGNAVSITKDNGVITWGNASSANYNLTVSGDTTNVTDAGITITITSNRTGYKGTLEFNYKITPKTLNGTENRKISEHMEATLNTTSFTYTGNVIRVKAADVKLVDKETGADLSAYLQADADGYVSLKNTSAQEAGETSFVLNLIKGQPTSGIKNYYIDGNGITDPDGYRTITTGNKATVAKRDLTNVEVSIKAQAIPEKASDLKLDAGDVTFKDKTTGETLNLIDDVDVDIPENATSAGTYTVTFKAKDTDNVTGTVTGQMRLVAADLSGAEFTGTGWNTSEEYTGEAITKTDAQLGSLKLDGKVIDKSLYEVTYDKNINVGEAKIIVKGKGDFEGSEAVFKFQITPAKVTDDDITANSSVEYLDTKDAADYKDNLGLVVKAKNSKGKEFTLEADKDYTVKYSFENNKNEIGSNIVANITITNKNFIKDGAKEFTKRVAITAKVLKSENIKLAQSEFTYTGKPIEPEFDIVIDGKIIDPSLFTATYSDNINAGTATLTVKGNSTDYASEEVSVTYTINPAETSSLEGAIASKEYKGYSLTLEEKDFNLTLGGEKVNVYDNFTLTYGTNVEIGEGTVTLTPKNGNFTGTATLTFQIVGKALNAGGSFSFYENGILVTNKDNVFSYDGIAHKFEQTVFTYAGSEELVEGEDYDIVYVDNVYGKDATAHGRTGQDGAVLAIAKGEYGSTRSNGHDLVNGVYTDAEGNTYTNVISVQYFTIAQQNVVKSNVSVSNGTYAAGLQVAPNVSILVNGVLLQEGKDYELEYEAGADRTSVTNSNSLKVTVVPKNGYTTNDTLTFNWGIDKFNLANADVSADGDTVTVKCGRVDVETSEYTVTREGSNLTVTAVEGSKNYTGSKTINVEVEDEKPAAPVIAEVNVSGNNATVVLSGESDGATGYDYVISTDRDCINNKDYDKVNKNILSTETTFTYTQQGVYYAYCHAWKRVNGEKVFSDWSEAYPFSVSAITPEQPVITSVKKSGRNLTVTWTQSENATTGYDVVMGTAVRKVNGELRPVEYGKAVKKVGPNTFSVTFKSIPKGTYYVGLHAHNRTSETGVKVFSPWSNYKTVKF